MRKNVKINEVAVRRLGCRGWLPRGRRRGWRRGWQRTRAGGTKPEVGLWATVVYKNKHQHQYIICIFPNIGMTARKVYKLEMRLNDGARRAVDCCERNPRIVATKEHSPAQASPPPRWLQIDVPRVRTPVTGQSLSQHSHSHSHSPVTATTRASASATATAQPPAPHVRP